MMRLMPGWREKLVEANAGASTYTCEGRRVSTRIRLLEALVASGQAFEVETTDPVLNSEIPEEVEILEEVSCG